jgi:hypothetical protein
LTKKLSYGKPPVPSHPDTDKSETFIRIRTVHQNRKDEKNSDEFFSSPRLAWPGGSISKEIFESETFIRIRTVHSDREVEKNPSGFFEG